MIKTAQSPESSTQDFCIQPKRPIADVIDIQVYPFFHFVWARQNAGMSHGLRKPRNSGLYTMPHIVNMYERLIFLIVTDHIWPGSYQGHIAPPYIEKLGQFINVMFTQKF